MTVAELIEKLKAIPNQQAKVQYLEHWTTESGTGMDEEIEVASVYDFGTHVHLTQ